MGRTLDFPIPDYLWLIIWLGRDEISDTRSDGIPPCIKGPSVFLCYFQEDLV